MNPCRCCKSAHRDLHFSVPLTTDSDEELLSLSESLLTDLGPTSSSWFEELTESCLTRQKEESIVSTDVSIGWSPCPRGGIVAVDDVKSKTVDACAAPLSTSDGSSGLNGNSSALSSPSYEHLGADQLEIKWTDSMATPLQQDSSSSISTNGSDWRDKMASGNTMTPIDYDEIRKVTHRKLFSPAQSTFSNDSLYQVLEAAEDGNTTVEQELTLVSEAEVTAVSDVFAKNCSDLDASAGGRLDFTNKSVDDTEGNRTLVSNSSIVSTTHDDAVSNQMVTHNPYSEVASHDLTFDNEQSLFSVLDTTNDKGFSDSKEMHFDESSDGMKTAEYECKKISQREAEGSAVKENVPQHIGGSDAEENRKEIVVKGNLLFEKDDRAIDCDNSNMINVKQKCEDTRISPKVAEDIDSKSDGVSKIESPEAMKVYQHSQNNRSQARVRNEHYDKEGGMQDELTKKEWCSHSDQDLDNHFTDSLSVAEMDIVESLCKENMKGSDCDNTVTTNIAKTTCDVIPECNGEKGKSRNEDAEEMISYDKNSVGEVAQLVKTQNHIDALLSRVFASQESIERSSQEMQKKLSNYEEMPILQESKNGSRDTGSLIEDIDQVKNKEGMGEESFETTVAESSTSPVLTRQRDRCSTSVKKRIADDEQGVKRRRISDMNNVEMMNRTDTKNNSHQVEEDVSDLGDIRRKLHSMQSTTPQSILKNPLTPRSGHRKRVRFSIDSSSPSQDSQSGSSASQTDASEVTLESSNCQNVNDLDHCVLSNEGRKEWTDPACCDKKTEIVKWKCSENTERRESECDDAGDGLVVKDSCSVVLSDTFDNDESLGSLSSSVFDQDCFQDDVSNPGVREYTDNHGNLFNSKSTSVIDKNLDEGMAQKCTKDLLSIQNRTEASGNSVELVSNSNKENLKTEEQPSESNKRLDGPKSSSNIVEAAQSSISLDENLEGYEFDDSFEASPVFSSQISHGKSMKSKEEMSDAEMNNEDSCRMNGVKATTISSGKDAKNKTLCEERDPNIGDNISVCDFQMDDGDDESMWAAAVLVENAEKRASEVKESNSSDQGEFCERDGVNMNNSSTAESKVLSECNVNLKLSGKIDAKLISSVEEINVLDCNCNKSEKFAEERQTSLGLCKTSATTVPYAEACSSSCASNSVSESSSLFVAGTCVSGSSIRIPTSAVTLSSSSVLVSTTSTVSRATPVSSMAVSNSNKEHSSLYSANIASHPTQVLKLPASSPSTLSTAMAGTAQPSDLLCHSSSKSPQNPTHSENVQTSVARDSVSLDTPSFMNKKKAVLSLLNTRQRKFLYPTAEQIKAVCPDTVKTVVDKCISAVPNNLLPAKNESLPTSSMNNSLSTSKADLVAPMKNTKKDVALVAVSSDMVTESCGAKMEDVTTGKEVGNQEEEKEQTEHSADLRDTSRMHQKGSTASKAFPKLLGFAKFSDVYKEPSASNGENKTSISATSDDASCQLPAHHPFPHNATRGTCDKNISHEFFVNETVSKEIRDRDRMTTDSSKMSNGNKHEEGVSDKDKLEDESNFTSQMWAQTEFSQMLQSESGITNVNDDENTTECTENGKDTLSNPSLSGHPTGVATNEKEKSSKFKQSEGGFEPRAVMKKDLHEQCSTRETFCGFAKASSFQPTSDLLLLRNTSSDVLVAKRPAEDDNLEDQLENIFKRKKLGKTGENSFITPFSKKENLDKTFLSAKQTRDTQKRTNIEQLGKRCQGLQDLTLLQTQQPSKNLIENRSSKLASFDQLLSQMDSSNNGGVVSTDENQTAAECCFNSNVPEISVPEVSSCISEKLPALLSANVEKEAKELTGFSTAGGKAIALSEASKQKAQEIWQTVAKEETNVKFGNNSVRYDEGFKEQSSKDCEKFDAKHTTTLLPKDENKVTKFQNVNRNYNNVNTSSIPAIDKRYKGFHPFKPPKLLQARRNDNANKNPSSDFKDKRSENTENKTFISKENGHRQLLRHVRDEKLSKDEKSGYVSKEYHNHDHYRSSIGLDHSGGSARKLIEMTSNRQSFKGKDESLSVFKTGSCHESDSAASIEDNMKDDDDWEDDSNFHELLDKQRQMSQHNTDTNENTASTNRNSSSYLGPETLVPSNSKNDMVKNLTNSVETPVSKVLAATDMGVSDSNYGVGTDKTLSSNKNVCSFGFSTASGMKVAVSEQALVKVKNLSSDFDISFNSEISLGGFKQAAVSEMKTHVSNTAALVHNNIDSNGTGSTVNPDHISGASVTNTKQVVESDRALGHVKRSLDDLEYSDEDNISSRKLLKSALSVSKAPETGTSLTEISLNNARVYNKDSTQACESLDMIVSSAAVNGEFMDSTGNALQNHDKTNIVNKSVSLNMSADSHTPLLVDRGFSTASGKKAIVSENALRRAKQLFDDANNAVIDSKVMKININGCNDKNSDTTPSRKNANQGLQIPGSLKMESSTTLEEKANVSRKALQHVEQLFDNATEHESVGSFMSNGNDSDDENIGAASTRMNINRDFENPISLKIGFSTASGHGVTVSERALRHAQQFLNDAESTASNENTNSLKESKEGCDGKNTAAVPSNKTNRDSRVPISLPMGFVTASGNQATVSEKALRHAKQQFDDAGNCPEVSFMKSNSNKSAAKGTLVNKDNTSLIVSAQQQKFEGFSTAGSPVVNVSADLPRHAVAVFSSEDNDNVKDNSSNIVDKYKDHTGHEVPIPFPKFEGFSTAGGSIVKVSSDALKHAAALFSENSLKNDSSTAASTCTSNNKSNEVSAQQPKFQGFSTAGGSKVTVSTDALKQAAALFSSENENCLKNTDSSTAANTSDNKGTKISAEQSRFEGFSTAGGCVVKVSSDALKHAAALFSGEEEDTSVLAGKTIRSTSPVSFATASATAAASKHLRSDSAASISEGPGIMKPLDTRKCMSATTGRDPVKVRRDFMTPLTSKCEELQFDRRSVRGKRLSAMFAHSLTTEQGDASCVLHGGSKSFKPPYKKMKLDDSTPLSVASDTISSFTLNKSGNDALTAPRFVPPPPSTSSSSSVSSSNIREKTSHIHTITTTKAPVFLAKKPGGNLVPQISRAVKNPTDMEQGSELDDEEENRLLCQDFDSDKQLQESSSDKMLQSDGCRYYEKEESAFSGIPGANKKKNSPSTEVQQIANMDCDMPDAECLEREIDNEIMQVSVAGSENVTICEQVAEDLATNKETTNEDLMKTYESVNNGADSKDCDLSNCALELARMKQEKIIRMKKRGRVRPLCGRWLETRKVQKKEMKTLQDDGLQPVWDLSRDELVNLGVPEAVMEINSLSARDFRFDLQRFYPALNSDVLVGDGALLVPDKSGFAGVEEFYRAFRTLGGVDPSLVDDVWFENHYRWIVWKLAAYEVSLPHHFGGRSLTPDLVMLQLKYRYDREIDGCQRSAIKKIVERDDTPCKRMVLCVASVMKQDDGQFSVTLTDGWYSINAQLDNCLMDLVARKRLWTGVKVITSGAELVGCQDACGPLEIKEGTVLKLHGNSTRPAPWHARLGFCCPPSPLCVPLGTLHPGGGVVGCVDIVVTRKYPVMYMEKLPEGGCVFRTAEEEDKVRQKHEESQQSQLEKIYNTIQREMEDSRGDKKRGRRSYSRKEIEKLWTGQELSEALDCAMSPEEIQQSLNASQMDRLLKHKQTEIDRRQQEMNSRVKEAMAASGIANRTVAPVQKFRLSGCCRRDIDDKINCLLTVWRPGTEWTEVQEGNRYRLFHLSLAASRGRHEISKVSLTATRQTRIQPRPISDNLLDLVYEPREAWTVSELISRHPPQDEFDFVGVTVQISTSQRPSGPTLVYAADREKNILCIRLWTTSQSNLLRLNQCFIATSLVLGRHSQLGRDKSYIPAADVRSDFTAISTPGHSRRYSDLFTEVQNLSKTPDFLASAQAKISSQHPSSIAHSRDSNPLVVARFDGYTEDFPPDIVEKIFSPMSQATQRSSSQRMSSQSSKDTSSSNSEWLSGQQQLKDTGMDTSQNANMDILNRHVSEKSEVKNSRQHSQYGNNYVDGGTKFKHQTLVSINGTDPSVPVQSTSGRQALSVQHSNKNVALPCTGKGQQNVSEDSSHFENTPDSELLKKRKLALRQKMSKLLSYDQPSPLAQLSNGGSPASRKEFKSPFPKK